jgi:chorismate lyase / 3-hydroxybenzoate synthase
VTALAQVSADLGLGFQRLSPSACGAADAPRRTALGRLGHGVFLPGAVAAADAPTRVAARLLWPAGPLVDVWIGGAGPQRSGVCGSVRWRHDERWLHGTLELDETLEQCGLGALAERAYRDVFATLAHSGHPHLLRVWNYLPHINADDSGMERYRQFNAGRQQAFLHAGRAAFEGAPAACAVGTHEGPFCVHFLAARSAAVALENPRQVAAYHYPSEYGPRSPSFSRAALVDAGAGGVALLISGTASIVGHRSVHVGDVAAQTRETLANLRAVLCAAHARSSARFDLAALHCTVYLRHAQHLPLIRAELAAALSAESFTARTAVYLEADICRSDLWVEIEAHAFAHGEVLA